MDLLRFETRGMLVVLLLLEYEARIIARFWTLVDGLGRWL